MNQSSGDASIGARYLSDSLKKTRTTKTIVDADQKGLEGRGGDASGSGAMRLQR